MKRSLLILIIFILAMVGNSFLIVENYSKSEAVLDTDSIETNGIDEVGMLAEIDDRPPRIPVFEYHNFAEEEARWTRTPENFYDDLLWLYNNDYRPVTVADYLAMEFKIDPGMKPFILSFDDASKTQFRVLEDGTIDPDCAVGIMNRFILEHPDFGTSATFFALPYSFGQPSTTEAKLKYLDQTGREIGSHTYGHEDLATLDGELIRQSLALHEEYMREKIGDDYRVRAIAYPLGHYPDGDLFEYVKAGEFEGYEYQIDAGFLVGASPALMPDDEYFNAYKIPRIQAIDEQWEMWFNREPGETGRSEVKESFHPYVVTSEHSIGVSELPDLGWYLPGEETEVEEISDEILEGTVRPGTVEQEISDEILEGTVEQEISDEILPYESCAPFVIDRTSIAKTAWKFLEYNLYKVQINQVPKSLVYRNGQFYYTIIGDEGNSISEQFFPYSNHYRNSDFKQRILDVNLDSNFAVGDEIEIPDIPKILVKRSVSEENLWGIYLTSYYSVSNEGKRLIEELQNHGGRLVIFDVKEIDGYVYFQTDNEMVKATGADAHIIFRNLENYVRYWHDRDIYLAARVVIFKDINLSSSRPDLAIKDVNGQLWQNSEGSVWLDPSNIETQDYILELVEELAKTGIDEIQFDYIRFPTMGPVQNTAYNFDEENVEKYEIIRNFIARVHDRLLPYDTKLSMDVYGVIAWNNAYDAGSTGQKMECLGPFIDVVYPMVYPSHFGPGFGGFANPGDHPYYFVDESMKLFAYYLRGTDTKIRPWLQAFAWRVNNYGQWYIDEQVKAAADNGINEYALWNASNRYFEM
ncbi:polysaccharide deacetylase family protein [Patescibacteria group bacterium]|nr:polysaccharide deacetylase family protein [Patescibacteria group bacterium]